MKYKTYLLFGAPGAGKGTQGKILGTVPGFVHVASGDLFRSLDPQSEAGKIFREYADRGQLVPDDFTVRLWGHHVQRLIEARRFDPDKDYLLLDGIPRNVRQAELMDPHIQVMKLIHLTAGDALEAIVQRLKLRSLREGRSDDKNEQVINKRMEVYRNETVPLLKHFPESLRLDVNALQTPIEVARDILIGICANGNFVAPRP